MRLGAEARLEPVVAEGAHRPARLGAAAEDERAVPGGGRRRRNAAEQLAPLAQEGRGLLGRRAAGHPLERLVHPLLVPAPEARQRAGLLRQLGPPLDERGEPAQARGAQQRAQLGRPRRVEVREHERRGGGEEGGALELGRVDVRGGVAGGVDVAVGPVVEVDRRHREGGLVPDVVVAAGAVVGELGEQRLLAALGGDQRELGAAARREGAGLAVRPGAERRGHVVHERGQARRPARDVEDRLGRRAATDHVEVDRGAGAPRDLGTVVQQRQRALDLGREDEAQGARRPRQAAVGDQRRERPRHFQDGGATAGVVVGARPRVVEVAGEDQLLLASRRVGAGEGRGDHVVGAVVLPGAHSGVQANRLAAREPRLQLARRAERDHERERGGGVEAADVPPAHQGGVVPPPGRALVLGVADDAGGAEALDGDGDDRLRLRRGQHEAPAHLAARVVLGRRARPDVDQLRLHLAALAVLRERERHRLPARETARARPALPLAAQLPELGEVGVPGPARALRAVEGLAVGGNVQDLRVGQPEAAQLRRDQLGGREVAARAAHAVLPREPLEVALRGLAGELLGERDGARVRQQRRRFGAQGCDGEQEEGRERGAGHGASPGGYRGCECRGEPNDANPGGGAA